MLPPSEARTPRLVTSVMSGAVTWTTSVPARPRDGQRGHLGDHRLAVGARWQHRQRPVHLEPELGHRPDRVVLLHLGDGDPRGRALGRIVQHRRCTPGVPGGEPGHLLVHRRQGLHFALRGLCFPGGQPLRRGGFGGAGLPGDGAAGLGLGAAGVLPGLLVQQPQRAPGRRLAVRCSGTRAASRSVPPVTATARELNRSITSWLTPPTSAPLPSARGHHGVAQRGQPGLHDPVGDRGDAEPLVVQAAGVQGAPFARRRRRRAAPGSRSATCTCSCGSPSRLMWCRNTLATRPSPSRHSPVRAEWCPVRV